MSGLSGNLSPVPTMSGGLSTGITTDYNNLQNLPLVNGSVLEGGENINLIPQTAGATIYSSILGLNRGALVFYDNQLYMNTSGASTTGGDFDPSKWTSLRISNLFVNNLNNILGGYYTNQWRNSGSYVLEDIVIYNGLIYVCIVDNATAGTFVNNEWTQISVYNIMDKKIEEAKTSMQVTGTASGSIATFDDGSANPIKELTAQIEAVQSGSGDPSPINICPISGWDGANVGDTSDKGQFFKGLVFGSYKSVDMGDLNWQYNSTNAYFRADISDLKQASLNLLCADYTTGTQNDPANITNNMITSASSSTYVYIKDSNYTNANTFKTALSGKHLVYELATPITPTITLTQFTDLLTEFGLDGWLQSISWQTECGTVYGGNFKLFKDGGKWYITVNSCPYFASYNGETLVGEWISDRDVYAVGTTPTIGAQVVNIGGEVTTTTFEIDTEIATLLGNNNIFADCGDVDVKYIRDLNLVINKLLNA